MSKYLYAFSADPITKGHRNVIERILDAHPNDELIVGIGVNPDKTYMFSLPERKNMVEEYLSDLNVKIVSFEGMLTDYALENDIKVIYRGIRNSSDIDAELNLFYALRMQESKIEIHFIPAHEEMTTVSSSLVKAIVKEYGDVTNLVPIHVKAALEAKILGQYIMCITGEICSGKSYILDKIRNITISRGITTHHLDLDVLGHQILEELTEDLYVNTRLEIANVFGSEVINSDGFINRSILGEIVFSEPSFMETLNNIMEDAMLIRIARTRAKFGEGLILVDGALITEFMWESKFNNNVWLLDTTQSVRMDRLHNRNLTTQQIDRREKCQFTTEQKINQLNSRECNFTLLKNPQNLQFGRMFQYINKLIHDLDIYGELRFKGLLKRIDFEGDISSAYIDIFNKYSESHRHYHTIKHITNGLNEMWVRAEHNLKYTLNEVEFAWWFHDYIYNVTVDNNNESLSADYAKQFCNGGNIDKIFSNDICELIIDTKHNAIPNTYNGKFICDLDLLIFTEDENIFIEYEYNIRNEYKSVDNTTYVQNRKLILIEFINKFVKTKTTFYTFGLDHTFKAVTNLNMLLECIDKMYGGAYH